MPRARREWFEQLRDTVDWRQQRRPMYDRVVDVPRLTSGYALDGTAVLPEALAAAHAAVRELTRIPFTHVGLNFYRDGNDSVAPHNDKLATLIPGIRSCCCPSAIRAAWRSARNNRRATSCASTWNPAACCR